MQFYISVIFLGFPDKIHKEKPSFLDVENNWLRTDRRTDGRTDRPSYRDARTHLKMLEWPKLCLWLIVTCSGYPTKVWKTKYIDIGYLQKFLEIIWNHDHPSVGSLVRQITLWAYLCSSLWCLPACLSLFLSFCLFYFVLTLHHIFSGATTHLYKRSGPSVGPSIGPVTF